MAEHRYRFVVEIPDDDGSAQRFLNDIVERTKGGPRPKLYVVDRDGKRLDFDAYMRDVHTKRLSDLVNELAPDGEG